MVNYIGPNDSTRFAESATARTCLTGYYHIDRDHPIVFSDAYGAGMVNVGAAVARK
jgi:hypothetical protein